MSGFTTSATGRAMAREIRRGLNRRAVTQEMLARRANMNMSMVNRILNQRETVGKLTTWDAMAKALGGRWEVRLVLDDEEEGV